MHAERHTGRARRRGNAEEIEIGFKGRFGRRQNDRKLGGPRPCDHALVGDRLGCDVAEHRRHQAV